MKAESQEGGREPQLGKGQSIWQLIPSLLQYLCGLKIWLLPSMGFVPLTCTGDAVLHGIQGFLYL